MHGSLLICSTPTHLLIHTEIKVTVYQKVLYEDTPLWNLQNTDGRQTRVDCCGSSSHLSSPGINTRSGSFVSRSVLFDQALSYCEIFGTCLARFPICVSPLVIEWSWCMARNSCVIRHFISNQLTYTVTICLHLQSSSRYTAVVLLPTTLHYTHYNWPPCSKWCLTFPSHLCEFDMSILRLIYTLTNSFCRNCIFQIPCVNLFLFFFNL